MYIVDGKEITEEEFNALKNDPSVKLIETAPGQYKTKQRLYG